MPTMITRLHVSAINVVRRIALYVRTQHYSPLCFANRETSIITLGQLVLWSKKSIFDVSRGGEGGETMHLARDSRNPY